MNPECDKEIINALADYIVNATEDPEFQKTLKSLGFTLNVKPTDEYTKMMVEEEEQLKEIAPLLGWA